MILIYFFKLLKFLGGKSMSHIRDVAKKAGVSVTTVSRVINNKGYISNETRKKVEKAMKEINYTPNPIARALQRGESSIIGVIVPDSNHPFFSELIKFIEIYANEQNYKVMICNSLENPEIEAQYINMLLQNRVDGIIMCSETIGIKEYKEINLPIVSFDRVISDNFPYVGSDNFRGGELATEHLIERGCKSLLHIAGPSEHNRLSNRRGDAFKIKCMDNNIPYQIIEGARNNLTFEYFQDFIIKEVSKHLSKFDGVFCSNDILAYALYIYATEQGIKVPEQLKIVGYDYHGFTRMLQNPKLTTIKQPINKIGKVLCSTIIQMISGNDHDTINNSIIDVELILGETT
jgi:LacI family transcriptional regulator, sucrose operon repressor